MIKEMSVCEWRWDTVNGVRKRTNFIGLVFHDNLMSYFGNGFPLKIATPTTKDT